MIPRKMANSGAKPTLKTNSNKSNSRRTNTSKNAFIDLPKPLSENSSSTWYPWPQVAAGGMHCAALTHDNEVLILGVNDHSTLGRDTSWDGGLVDVKEVEDDSDSDSESGLNPKECTNRSWYDRNPRRNSVYSTAGSGNATFALTKIWFAYGWGIIRVSLFTFPCVITYLLINFRGTIVSLASHQLSRPSHAQLSYHR